MTTPPVAIVADNVNDLEGIERRLSARRAGGGAASSDPFGTVALIIRDIAELDNAPVDADVGDKLIVSPDELRVILERHLQGWDAAPSGDWLWGKLMDWCRKRGTSPAQYNDLFAIVGEARAALQGGDAASEAVTDAKLLALASDYRSTYQHGGTTFDEFDALGFARALLTSNSTEKSDGWVSVHDRLPSDGCPVLVWSKQSWEKEPSAKIDCWAMQREAPLSFSSATIETGFGWDDHDDFESVTAWQPIEPPPTAPKAHGGRNGK